MMIIYLGVVPVFYFWIMRHSYTRTWLLWKSFLAYMYVLDTGAYLPYVGGSSR